MVKIIGSIALLIAMVIGGYFADAKFKSQIDGMLGKGKPQVTESVDKAAPDRSVAKAGGRLDAIQSAGVVRVSVQNPSKPFFVSDNGQAKGFNVDFMKILFAQSEFKGNIKLDTDHAVETYADVPKQLLSNKQVDIAIDGLTFNDEDLAGVVYTTPYVKDFGYSLIMAKGEAAGPGMRVGILQGDPDAKAFAEQAFPDAKIVELSDKADADGKWIVGHIKSKKVDAVMYDYPFAVAEVAGTDLQFAQTKIKGSDIQYRIGVRKEDKDLLAALNSAIRKSMEDSRYPDMLKTYFMSSSVAAVRRASSGEASYIVAKGDTLSTIAQSQLGNKMKYGDIQTRNNLANPNFIAVGQKLIIPK